jgi:hypothetical protein
VVDAARIGRVAISARKLRTLSLSPVTALILLGIAAICGVSGAILFVLAIVDGSRWVRDRMAMRRIYYVLYNPSRSRHEDRAIGPRG